jgi:hypothetical protein
MRHHPTLGVYMVWFEIRGTPTTEERDRLAQSVDVSQ